MKNDKLQKASQRKEAILQGAYDGRYCIKIVDNKKSKFNRKLARKKVLISDY